MAAATAVLTLVQLLLLILSLPFGPPLYVCMYVREQKISSGTKRSKTHKKEFDFWSTIPLVSFESVSLHLFYA